MPATRDGHIPVALMGLDWHDPRHEMDSHIIEHFDALGAGSGGRAGQPL